MRRVIFTLIAFSLITSAIAQDKKKMGNPNSPWKKGGMMSINLGQSGSRNWAAGSEKFSLSFAGYLNLWAVRKAGKNTWDNNLNIGYSLINTSSVGVRKLDDKFDFVSKYTYGLTKQTGVGFFANVRTQLTNGYDYTEEKRRRISGFFAPGYVTFAPGVNWQPTSYFSAFFAPLAAHWVVVTNSPYSFNYQGGVKPDGSSERSLASLYDVDPEKKVRFEAGPFISLKFNKDVCKNVYYGSRMDLMSDLTNDEPTNVDVYWTNFLGMRVNKWLHVTYSFDLISDNNVKMFGVTKRSPATQLKGMLGVGVTAKF
jgi:hypothetical protein